MNMVIPKRSARRGRPNKRERALSYADLGTPHTGTSKQESHADLSKPTEVLILASDSFLAWVSLDV